MSDSGSIFVKPPVVTQPIDIVVPCHNRLELTMTCVDAIYRNTAAPFNLIVVDDSTDKITRLYWKELQKEYKNIEYIYSTQPFKEGNQYLNLAFKRAKNPYIACVGNSIRVEPDWEAIALNVFKTDQAVGIVGFKNLYTHEPPGNGNIESAGITVVNFTPVDIGKGLPAHRMTSLYECPAVQWAFCMVRKEAVTNPPMPEGVYHGFRGWDDIDNCFVLRKRGWKVVYNGYGVGYHFPRATRGSNTKVVHDTNRDNARRFYKRWDYWDQFTKGFGVTQPDGTPWPEDVTPVAEPV